MKHEDQAFLELERHGLLMQSDARLPSVSSIVAGSPIRGSWWAHPRGREIFGAIATLAEHPDVLAVKLVSRKMTLVHRRLWPALLAVARSDGPWQTRGLPATARSLLSRVRDERQLRTDRLSKGQAAAAKPLEERLLIHASEIHTETGAHAKVLESWPAWAARQGLASRTMPADEARRELERVVAALNERFDASGRLPWQD